MNLSKSKYTLGIQCEKILWLDKYKSEVKENINNDAVYETGTNVGILAQQLFDNYKVVEFNSDLSKMINDTSNYLKEEYINLCEASFNYDHNFCSVDILVKKKDKYEIYEVKSSTHVSDVYLDDVSYQYYVLKSLGLNVVKASIVYLNSNYIRKGDLNIHELFSIKDVTDIAIDKLPSIKENINKINKYMENTNELNKDIGEYCFSPYECPYFKYCSRHLPKNNIFNIRGMQLNTKIKLYKKGIVSYEDLLNEDINEKYKQQIEFELYNLKPHINIDKVQEVLDKLYYPMYFLDFESYQKAVPEYDYMRPYEQIPFQYSLHYILDENEELQHKEFLSEANIDPRRLLAEQLVKDIPKDSCVLAYNMQFEKMIIRNLASINDDLANDLMNIHNHIQDLMIPFKDRDYYTKEMYGSYSIKYVLPALFPNDPSLDYHNLNLVHKGDEASNSFINLSSMNQEEEKELREALLRYCELDTFAMVKIWEKLKEVTR